PDFSCFPDSSKMMFPSASNSLYQNDSARRLAIWITERNDMAHCPSSADLRDYALGKLVDDRYELVEQHIDTCDLCLTALETLDLEGDDVLQALQHVPSANTQIHNSGWKDVEELVKAIGVEWSQAGDGPAAASVLPQQRLRDYNLLEKL